jgi:hypothetical protein
MIELLLYISYPIVIGLVMGKLFSWLADKY